MGASELVRVRGVVTLALAEGETLDEASGGDDTIAAYGL